MYISLKPLIGGFIISTLFMEVIYPFMVVILNKYNIIKITERDKVNVDVDSDSDISDHDDSSSDYSDDSEIILDEEYKMVIVTHKKSVNLVLQKCVNGTILAYKKLEKFDKQKLFKWARCGQKKIFLQTKNKEEINNIYEAATQKKVLAVLYETETDDQKFLVIGPDSEDRINQLTGHLKLF